MVPILCLLSMQCLSTSLHQTHCFKNAGPATIAGVATTGAIADFGEWMPNVVLGTMRISHRRDAHPCEREFKIEAKLLERGKDEEAPEVLTAPQMQTSENERAEVSSGQIIKVGGETIEYGSRISIRVKSKSEKTAKLQLTIELTKLVEHGEDHAAVRSDKYLFAREVKLNEWTKCPVKPRLEKETWLEIRVSELK